MIAGSDDFHVKRRADELAQQLKPEDPMNLEIIDGQADNVEDAIKKVANAREALQTLPFFGGGKLVHFRAVNFLGDGVVAKSERVIDAVLGLLEAAVAIPPAEARLLISATSIDQRRSFFKTASKQFLVELHNQPDLRSERDQEAWIEHVEKMMHSMGMTPAPGVGERLLDLVGGDTRALHNELEKLLLFSHPHGRVDTEAVRTICSSTRETIVWDLCDAVLLGRAPLALHLCRQLLAQGESEVGILILLSGQIRLAAVGRHLEESNRLRVGNRGTAELKGDAAALLPKNKKGEPPNAFRLGRIVQQARRRPAAAWLGALDILFDTGLQLVTSSTDRGRLLETSVVKLCSV